MLFAQVDVFGLFLFGGALLIFLVYKWFMIVHRPDIYAKQLEYQHEQARAKREAAQSRNRLIGSGLGMLGRVIFKR